MLRNLGTYKTLYLHHCPLFFTRNWIEENEADISNYLEILLEKPKYAYYYSIGLAIKAITEKDHTAFLGSLERLLSIHNGMAKHGMLRESPEGFICLPAMTLIYSALTRGILVNVHSEYISIDYLKYIYLEFTR